MANLKFKVEALRTLASPYRKGDNGPMSRFSAS